MRSVPRRSDRTTQNQAEFLVDKGEYVFGRDPTGGRAGETLAIRRQLFRDYVEEARASVGGATLAAVVAFLDRDIPAEIEKLLSPETAAERSQCAGELFAFVYEPDGGLQCVHDDPHIKAWFAQRLERAGGGLSGQCLVTGLEDQSLTRLHGKPKGIPPRSKTKGGVPLTSVNNDAFKSYHLDDVQCAPHSQYRH
jgi:hypothetical protein